MSVFGPVRSVFVASAASAASSLVIASAVFSVTPSFIIVFVITSGDERNELIRRVLIRLDKTHQRGKNDRNRALDHTAL